LIEEGYRIHHVHEPSTLLFSNKMRLNSSKQEGDLIATFHAPPRSRLLGVTYSHLARILYNRVKLVLTATEKNARYLERHGIEDIYISPLWADPFFCPKESMFDKRKYVLNVSVVDVYHPYKNYPMFSRLGRFLRKKYDVDLIHVGLYDFKLPFVKHVGHVSRTELLSYYQNAMLFILPSKGFFEGFGVVAAEALSCASPVLVSDESGISEYLDRDFVSSLDEFETNLGNMIEELTSETNRLVKKAKNESRKFSHRNCLKVADKIEQIASSEY
jgi:glycosyltransferase involved in cell wall biosynthesis